MKARYESRVVLMTAVLFGLGLAAFVLWTGWERARFPGPLAVEEEWVLLAAVEPGAKSPFWTGWLVPWIGRLMSALHGPGFVDLRLLSLFATAWSLVLITRIAGHFAGPAAGIVAASFFAASYGIGGARLELAGGHALALAGVLQGAQLALLGWPRVGLGVGALVALLAFDAAGPRIGVGTWALDLATGLPCVLVFAALGAASLAGIARGRLWLALAFGATLLLGATCAWRSPFAAVLAICAGIAVRTMIRAFALLTPLHIAMRFVLLFAIFGQLGMAFVRITREVPTEPERRCAVAVASLVAELGGEVWAPTRPFTVWMHRRAFVEDPGRAKALLTGSALLSVPGAPHTHALPAFPPKQHAACRAGEEHEILWWHVRPEDAKLVERIRASTIR